MANSAWKCFTVLHKSGRTKVIVCSSTSLRKLSTSSQHLPFVPRSEEAPAEDINRLADFIIKSKRLFVLTGAGISTESGIPDYRSERVGLYATSTNRPIQYADFLNSAHSRQRYWARNFVGWPRFSSFEPNRAHRILSRWEHAGKIHWLVTQNVDALHHKAGSESVTELHGSTHRVTCLSCQNNTPRTHMQLRIKALNPDWQEESVEIAPDGDVNLSPEQIQGFKIPECERCGGILKPEVVFFGDNVPRPTVNFTFDRLDECDAMLVAGSSLEVYSGYRFANRASERHIPLTIINIGKTRADKLAHLKIDARCGHVLQRVHNLLTSNNS